MGVVHSNWGIACRGCPKPRNLIHPSRELCSVSRSTDARVWLVHEGFCAENWLVADNFRVLGKIRSSSAMYLVCECVSALGKNEDSQCEKMGDTLAEYARQCIYIGNKFRRCKKWWTYVRQCYTKGYGVSFCIELQNGVPWLSFGTVKKNIFLQKIGFFEKKHPG